MHTSSTLQSGDLPTDVRLVVADMDGTLLDESGSIPGSFWPLLDLLSEQGIVFAPASGRQFPALAAMFGEARPDVALISENGALVVWDGKEVACSMLTPELSERTVTCTRRLAGEFDLGLVLSGRHSAYVERKDHDFLDRAGWFYTSLTVVDDLLDAPEPALKFAVYDFDGASAGSMARLTEELDPLQVVMSSEHWMDLMDPAVNKGVAVRALRTAMGLGPDQLVVFGDYLNDLEMFAEASHTFAMANAHPRLARAARHIAPSNREHGVITTLARLIGAPAAS